LLGISRQAYYKRLRVDHKNILEEQIVLELVTQVRLKLKEGGTRQIYTKIKNELALHNIKMGRDKLHKLLKDNDLLMKLKRNNHKTTNSRHRFFKHPDLLKGLVLTRPEQVFVSDITYIKTAQGYNYLSLVTDAYSKQIMGYHLSEGMPARDVLKALKMAVKNRKYPDMPLIHHSDRGVQYCCDLYTDYQKQHNIKISMTQSSSPYDNAVAERINGILKQEFGIAKGFINHLQAVKEIKQSIQIYNTYRPHQSIEMMTPQMAHINPNFKLKTYKKI